MSLDAVWSDSVLLVPYSGHSSGLWTNVGGWAGCVDSGVCRSLRLDL